MAGGDEAFRERGFLYCKPLVEIDGRPLIQHAWECLTPLAADRFVFVARKDDARTAHLDEVLRLMDPTAEVVQAAGPTAGAACTVLLAIDHIDPDAELVIANGDQVFTCNVRAAVDDFRDRGLDAGTIVFDSVHPRWSFVRVGEDGLVTEAAEKRPISRSATAGFYYFRRGGDFLIAAVDMIRKRVPVNNGFYVCPTFNELILRHAKIGVFPIRREEYVSLASPQNVEEYEQSLAAARRAAASADLLPPLPDGQPHAPAAPRRASA
jgi:dTDP-glucose pyrophosphorylase